MGFCKPAMCIVMSVAVVGVIVVAQVGVQSVAEVVVVQ